VPYFGKSDREALVAAVDKREPPARPEERIPSNTESGDRLWSLLVHCWAYDPKARPTVDRVYNTVSVTLIDCGYNQFYKTPLAENNGQGLRGRSYKRDAYV
jgi:hypothetical protein